MAISRRAAALLAAGGVALALFVFHRPGADEPRPAETGVALSADRTDMAFITAVLNRVRKGEPYYPAATAELTARGYSLSSILNWRLPELSWVEARLPSLAIAQILLIIVGIWAAWLINAQLPRGATDQRMATLAASLTMLPLWIVSARIVVMHEVWAGELIALSLALWGPNRWLASVVTGLAATLMRELSVIYLFVMLVAALRDRRPREAAAWAAAIGVFAVIFAFHVRAVEPFLRPGSPHPWIVFGGTDFLLATFRADPVALLLPTPIFIMTVSAALVGLWCWRHPQGPRIAAFVSAFAVFTLFVGRSDNWYWGFLTAPIWPLGLVGFGTTMARRE